MARARRARSGAARPARARLQGGGAPPRRPAPRLTPRHAPLGSPRALGAARAGPPLPRAGGTRPLPPPPGSAARRASGRRRRGGGKGKAEEGKTAGTRSGRGSCGEESRPRRRRRRRVFSHPVAAAPAAAAGRAAPHRAGCAPLSLRRSLLLPAAALCSRAPCPSARRQPQQQQRRRRRLLQAPRRRLHIAHRAARRPPSCLPQLSPVPPGRPRRAPPRASGRAPSPRALPAPDAHGHLFAAPARDSPVRGSPQRRPGGAGSLNPCAASRPGAAACAASGDGRLIRNGPGGSSARPRPRPRVHLAVWLRPRHAHLGVWPRAHLRERPRPQPRSHLKAWPRPRPLSELWTGELLWVRWVSVLGGWSPKGTEDVSPRRVAKPDGDLLPRTVGLSPRES